MSINVTNETNTDKVEDSKDTGLVAKISNAISWRWRALWKPSIKKFLGIRNQQWARVVMDQECMSFISSLQVKKMDAIEMSPSSTRWKDLGFNSYSYTTYPEHDICTSPLKISSYDIVIMEQVLEHVDWPQRAICNVFKMLRPGGWFIVSTPFLFRIHAYPEDSSRWTERGLKCLLIECGFQNEQIQTGSWGNRACVKANLTRFPSWIPWWHSLKNEPLYPVVVWAFARK